MEGAVLVSKRRWEKHGFTMVEPCLLAEWTEQGLLVQDSPRTLQSHSLLLFQSLTVSEINSQSLSSGLQWAHHFNWSVWTGKLYSWSSGYALEDQVHTGGLRQKAHLVFIPRKVVGNCVFYPCPPPQRTELANEKWGKGKWLIFPKRKHFKLA